MKNDTDTCIKCGVARLTHRTIKNKNCPTFIDACAVGPIRYEIESDLPGLIINAPGIIGVCASRGRSTKSSVVVFVDASQQKDFEKEVEGNAHVIGYRADPDGTANEENAHASH